MKWDDVAVYIHGQLSEISEIISLNGDCPMPRWSIDNISSEKFESLSRVSSKLSTIIANLLTKQKKLEESQNKYEECFENLLTIIYGCGELGTLSCDVPSRKTISRQGGKFSFQKNKDGFSITFHEIKTWVKKDRIFLFFYKKSLHTIQPAIRVNLRYQNGLYPLLEMTQSWPTVSRMYLFSALFQGTKNNIITLSFSAPSSTDIKKLRNKLDRNSENIQKYSQELVIAIMSKIPDWLLENKHEILNYLENRYS